MCLYNRLLTRLWWCVGGCHFYCIHLLLSLSPITIGVVLVPWDGPDNVNIPVITSRAAIGNSILQPSAIQHLAFVAIVAASSHQHRCNPTPPITSSIATNLHRFWWLQQRITNWPSQHVRCCGCLALLCLPPHHHGCLCSWHANVAAVMLLKWWFSSWWYCCHHCPCCCCLGGGWHQQLSALSTHYIPLPPSPVYCQMPSDNTVVTIASAIIVLLHPPPCITSRLLSFFWLLYVLLSNLIFVFVIFFCFHSHFQPPYIFTPHNCLCTLQKVTIHCCLVEGIIPNQANQSSSMLWGWCPCAWLGYFCAKNVKRYLINYPHLSDYGQTIFCLSFPSRDRATAPGRYEQFYFTKHIFLSTKNKFQGRNQIRLDPVQLFCNSFCVQHKMVGDHYPFILQCLVYHKKGTVHHWGILTRP